VKLENRSLDGQLPHRCDPHIDGNGAEAAGFEREAPRGHSCFHEARPRLMAVPGEELILDRDCRRAS
jgi:hypothetical protein